MSPQSHPALAQLERQELLQICLHHYLRWLETISPASAPRASRDRLEDLIQRTRELLTLAEAVHDTSTVAGGETSGFQWEPELLSIASSACSTYLDSLAVFESFAEVGSMMTWAPSRELDELSTLVSQVRSLEASIASMQTAMATSH